jgi:hypothetical protein
MNKAFTFLEVATGILSTVHGENGPEATGPVADPHLTRLALDNVEWRERLARLAKLHRGESDRIGRAPRSGAYALQGRRP